MRGERFVGLDNSFILRNNRNNDAIELARFRNYYELNSYFKHDETISVDALTNLYTKIKPIVKSLRKLSSNKLEMYEEEGYPREYYAEFYNEEFSPCQSQSVYAGFKLMRLYSRIEAMIEILNNNENVYITFYTSY